MSVLSKALLFLFFLVSSVNGAVVHANLQAASGSSLGTVALEDTPYGLLIQPQFTGLPAGVHGFHVHEAPDCGDSGMKAGGHLDPHGTKSHQGPYGQGHLGDLPVLVVDEQGQSQLPVLAPRLKTTDVVGHALMVHAGGDNYTDTPPLGGGGARIACAVIVP
jgi:Cu-Zn family superoxide dismutase